MNRRESLAHLCAAALSGTTSSTFRAFADTTSDHPVLIEAGRRVDAPDAQTARFPPGNVEKVRQRIRESLQRKKPTAVVCSGACGTDLLLLEIAGELHIERLVLLPSSPETFRETSVIDRPGNWGALYDRVLKTAKVETVAVPEGQQGYLETNVMLLDRGEALARSRGVACQALVIWDQKSRGDDDVTGHFLGQAEKRGLAVLSISTL